MVIVPIYDPGQSGGHGSNYMYTIVDFAEIAVLATDYNGKRSEVIVQPVLTQTKDLTVIVGDPQESWAKGGVILLHLSQ